MAPRRFYFLLTVLFVLAAFIVFFERRLPTTQERLDKGDVIWDVNEGKLAKIVIERDNETLEFVRGQGDAWKMVKPENYPADASSLSSLVFDLARPARQGEASQSSAEPDYGLAKPRAVVTISTKEETDRPSETHTISIGKSIPGTDTVAARARGDNRTIFVRETLASGVLKPEESYKSRKIFEGSANDITQMTILRGRGRLDFEKRKGDWWMTRPLVDRAGEPAVSRLAGDLIAENVSEFVKLGKSDLSGAGLSPPIYSVTATIAGKPVILEIGATRSDGKSVYARSQGQTFAIESSITDELSKEADAYRETKVCRFESSAVSRFVMVLDGRSRSFTKSGVDWKEDAKSLPATSVDDALTALASIEGKDFLSSSEYQKISAHPEQLHLTIEQPEKASMSISFRSVDAKRVAARAADRPEALLIEAGALDRLTATLRKIPAGTPPPPPLQKTPTVKKTPSP
jgi:hypothetical protein